LALIKGLAGRAMEVKIPLGPELALPERVLPIRKAVTSNTNLSWEYISPGVPNTPAVIDYFYRAVHKATVVTKQLVKSYYSASISRAYFDGCWRKLAER
jgi:hypothetical protein